MAETERHDTLGGRSRAPELPLPYFEACSGDDIPTQSRVLLVSPHFPPDTSVGALRWEKFAVHFARYGWKLDVLARQPSQLDRSDPKRLESLPVGTRAFGVDQPPLLVDRLEARVRNLVEPVRTFRPGPLSKNVSRSSGRWSVRGASTRDDWLSTEEISRLAFTPRGVYRAYRAWRYLRQGRASADHAASLGVSLALSADYRAVISCGPPHWAHVAARRIAREIGRPLVVDLRDPWSLIEGLPEDMASPLWLRQAEHEEAACVDVAHLIVANTSAHSEALCHRYPWAADRIVTVLNGFDEKVFDVSSEPTDRFVVVYSGSIYGGRDPRSFFQAAGRVVRRLDLAPSDFTIEFLGEASSFDGRTLEDLAEEAGLAGHFVAMGVVPREEALRRAARASLLLNLPQYSQLCIPSKIYEYLQMDGRILALEEPGSATERLLRGEDADIVQPDDVEAIARVLRDRYEAFASGGSTSSNAPDPSLGRAAQAERLVRLLEDRVASPAHAAL